MREILLLSRISIIPRIRIIVRIPRNLIRRALPWRDVVHVHPVQFLQCTVLALDDKKVDDEDAGEKTAGEDIAQGKVDLGCDEGREESD